MTSTNTENQGLSVHFHIFMDLALKIFERIKILGNPLLGKREYLKM